MDTPVDGFSVIEQALQEGEAAALGEQPVDAPIEGEGGENLGDEPSSPWDGKAYSIDADEYDVGLVSGEKKISYKADGEKRTKTLDQLVDSAQKADYNERQLNKTRSQLKELSDKLTEFEQLNSAAQQDAEILSRILKGDDAFLTELRKRYNEALGNKPAGKPAEAPRDEPVDGYGNTTESQQQGLAFVMKAIKPWADQVAEAYDADPADLVKQVLLMADNEPSHTFGWDTLDDILNHRLINELEAAGYTRSKDAPRFDVEQWIPNESPPERVSSYITPKGERKRSASELAAENERLRTELAEKAVADGGPGPVSDTPGSKGGKGRSSSGSDGSRYRSDLIDVSEAQSADDIFEALDAMEQSAYRR